MSDDTLITQTIRAMLERDHRIRHPVEIAVASRAGTVTLRGTVSSLQQRRAAADIARNVQGVREVEDDLGIDPRDRWVDAETRGMALQALMSDERAPAERIQVKVADGWLTLKGEVQHQQESDAAFELVRGLPGVGGITNEIKVITAGIDG